MDMSVRDSRAGSAARVRRAADGSGGDGCLARFFDGGDGDGPLPAGDVGLDVLEGALRQAPGWAGAGRSTIPPMLTYLTAFVAHDLIDSPDLFGGGDSLGLGLGPGTALPAHDAGGDGSDRGPLRNARRGCCDLDSLYGASQAGGPHGLPAGEAGTAEAGGAALAAFHAALRDPADPARMRIGRFGPGTPPPLPRDGGGDLPRLAQAMDQGAGRLTAAQVAGLPPGVRAHFGGADGVLRPARALIAEPRNDATLPLAQVHLAYLRLHNALVAAWPHPRGAGDAEAVFVWARRHLRRLHQWLLVHAYLPALCDPAVVAQVLAEGPVLYDGLLADCGWMPGDAMPVPLEFAAAAFRFAPTMMRGAYDWNDRLGPGRGTVLPGAPADLLAAFTGTAEPAFFAKGDRLPPDWAPDWDRLVHRVGPAPDRSARRIDTHVAMPGSRLAGPGAVPRARNVIARTLDEGARLGLCSGQAAVAGLAARGIDVAPLSATEIAGGAVGAALCATGQMQATPLWVYLLREAEVRGDGQRLGPLGSHLVAGTLIGLIRRGPDPMLTAPGSVGGLWHPVDAPRVAGQVVDSYPAFLRAAGLCADPGGAV